MDWKEAYSKITLNRMLSKNYHIHISNTEWFPWYDVYTHMLWENDTKFEEINPSDFFKKYINCEFKLIDVGKVRGNSVTPL